MSAAGRRGARPRPPRGWTAGARATEVACWLFALHLLPLGAGASRGAATVDGAENATPAWPLALPSRFLTSNFMEYRGGRFHAGVDLKTDSQTGFPVVAAEAGWIDELRATPDGYGRMVVVRTAAGRRYLYAHLDRFADRLRGLVEAQQRREGRYRVTLRFGPGELPVARGEVIGLSGQSGTLGPHVHLEVRDASGQALDPLRCGFAVPDTFPPRILRVMALPVAPRSRIEGGIAVRAVADSGGLTDELPALAVRGPVAFAAEMVEFSDIRRHRLTPATVQVWLDGVEVFAADNHALPLTIQSHLRLEWLEIGERRAQWLGLSEADAVPGRRGGAWSALGEGLAPGRHRVQLAARDAAGNSATASWWLDVSGLAVGDSLAPRQDGSTATPAWSPDPLGRRLPDVGKGPRLLTPFLELEETDRGTAALPLLREARTDPTPGWVRLVLPPASGLPLLDTAVVYIAPDTIAEREAIEAGASQGLSDPGAAAWLVTPRWPATGPVPVPWPGAAPAGESRDAVYVQDETGAWTWSGRLEPPPADAGDATWTLPLRGSGRFAIWRDEIPPCIGAGPALGAVRRLAPRQRGGVSLPRWEILDVSLTDEGAGVDQGSIAALLDGRPLIVEPDPPRARVLVELPDSLRAGPHELELRVADRCGNEARRRLALTCGEG